MGRVKRNAQISQIQIILRMRLWSVVSNDSLSGQWGPCSDCVDAQADLGLRCPYMPVETFSHDPAHIIWQTINSDKFNLLDVVV